MIEENESLKKEIKEIAEKNAQLKVHLDELMDNQSNQDVSNKKFIKKEIVNFKNEFRSGQFVSDQKSIISIDEKKIHELSSEVAKLKQEQLKLKQTRIYVCDSCDFETTEKFD